MRSHTGSSSNMAPLQRMQFHQFLIPPFDRLKFTLLYVLATGFGWLLVEGILGSLRTPFISAFWQPQGMLGTLVMGLVSGLILGATQWLVLRRYVPDWLWILANAAGYVLFMITLQGWRDTIFARLATLSSQNLFWIGGLIGVILAVLCAVWLGFAQWLVLRAYAKPSWGWIFVPSIAILLAFSLFAGSLLLSQAGFFLPLDARVLGAGAFGTTQAIALCFLSKRTTGTFYAPNSLLATAPEMLDYGKVQSLVEPLERRLNQAWNQEISSDRPLIYQIGVDETGAIAAYESLDQSALDHADQTPLPDLLRSPIEPGGVEPPPPLARFQITFLPSGSLEIISWRGIPLLWIGFGMIITVILVAAIAGYLAGKLPEFTQ